MYIPKKKKVYIPGASIRADDTAPYIPREEVNEIHFCHNGRRWESIKGISNYQDPRVVVDYEHLKDKTN